MARYRFLENRLHGVTVIVIHENHGPNGAAFAPVTYHDRIGDCEISWLHIKTVFDQLKFSFHYQPYERKRK